jgi:DNA-binding CsgD family transcriptional regulator/tetratricopeptide (TPR) repeat protein
MSGQGAGFYYGRLSRHGGLRVMLWGRKQQCALLDGLIADTRAGHSRVLVVRGEPGIGKTALLEYAAHTAPDFQVARADGIESEMELPFAALHQLLGRMLDRLERLPPPQRDALGVAFGLQPGSAPNRFLVGLAVVGLLSDVAADQPLLVLVDDAQWLDQASAQLLAFVARRLDAESVMLLFGTREAAGEGCLAGLAELVLAGLSDSDARALLASALPGRLDERVRDRIIAESGGNPLALLELPRSATAAELAGGFRSAGPAPVASRIGQSFLRRIAALPRLTMRLLLLAAAEPTGDPALLRRAAAGLGISAADAAPAEADGLLRIGDRVLFSHPLVRSAIYQAAPVTDRRRAHMALAEATDPATDPDHRAWHRAKATAGPDEEVAAELERSAGRAQARGGIGAAAAFFERAALLTVDPARRARRALEGAQAKLLAGAYDAALVMLATAEAGPLKKFQRARAELLRGQIASASGHGSEAPRLMLKAARRSEPLDPALAREIYLEAFFAALSAGRFAIGGGVREVAAAARAGPSPPKPPHPSDLLLDGLALMIIEGYPAGAPMLKRATRAFRTMNITPEHVLGWGWHSCYGAALVWDYGSWDFLSARSVNLARDVGVLTALSTGGTTQQAVVHLISGDFAMATELVAEVESVTGTTGSGIAPYAALGLAALAGREAEASELIETGSKDAEHRGEGGGLTFIDWATAVLCNGLGRYDQALDAARQAIEASPADLFANWAAAELVEAATRIRVAERAVGPLHRLSAATRASGTDWALGVEARSRALVKEGDNAEVLYREAIDRLGRTRLRVDLARAHLLYGEWLRRAHRRIDAREQLRTAHQMLTAMGVDGFANRAARELRATGERVSKRTSELPAQLTARENEIARLADEGLSNPEIASRLFMSPRTVEYHLHKVFTKLAISSRNQLHGALASTGSRE